MKLKKVCRLDYLALHCTLILLKLYSFLTEWFSKRGSTLLGFEVHLKSGDETREVMYHFFLSDDTTQDAEAVLCAKHFLYTEVFPLYGKKKVRFRSDGAGCFSSKEAKSAMILFGEIAKVSNASFESSYKVSVAGCGKTALDVSHFNFFICLTSIY